jgi:hypothetical protein
VDPRTWTDINDMVSRADCVFIVLYHQHSIAQVAQVGEGAQQAFIVTLMQTDRRLVENVHNADQASTDLRGQAYALSLTAGQGLGAAIERQVVQPDIDQEAIASP